MDDNGVQARLHQGLGGTYLWITNPTRNDRTVRVSLAPSMGKFTSAEDLWGKQDVVLNHEQITVIFPPGTPRWWLCIPYRRGAEAQRKGLPRHLLMTYG